jgi:hypothetical protein
MKQIRQISSRRALALLAPVFFLTSAAFAGDDPPKKHDGSHSRAEGTPKVAVPTVQAPASIPHIPGMGRQHSTPPATGAGPVTPTPGRTRNVPAAGSAVADPAGRNGRAAGTIRPLTGTNPTGTATNPAVNPGSVRGNRQDNPGINNRPGSGNLGRRSDGIPGGNTNRNTPSNFRNPGRVETGRNGAQFQRDNRGIVREIHHGDLAIHRGPVGTFRSERVRPDGARLVGYRNGGYVERSYRYGGHEVYRRNFYYGGRTYSRFYNPYSYHGVALSVYAPSRYYSPGFYGYAYAPWRAPVAYSWGWGGSPWYGAYGGYFTPDPQYSSPSLWLTDYLVGQSLQSAYQAQSDPQSQQQQPQQQQGFVGEPQSYDNGPAPLTSEVKQQIAEEVRRQIALENSERQSTAPNAMPDPASSGIVRMLSDNATHVFVASAPLNLVVASGGECPVTAGDVLQLGGAPDSNATSAHAIVLASKGHDCAKGSRVQVALADLQEMQNHMRENIDQGLSELQNKQGTGGLPSLPSSASAPPVEAGFAAIAPPPDASESVDLTKQVQDASQAEQDALAEALSGPADSTASSAAPGGSPAPATVSLGQTTSQVEAIMGKPKSVANLPTKTIYVYDGLKVVFVNGKVSDVQ